METPEYGEEPKAMESFNTLATAILQAPPEKKKKQPMKAASEKKPKRSNPDLHPRPIRSTAYVFFGKRA